MSPTLNSASRGAADGGGGRRVGREGPDVVSQRHPCDVLRAGNSLDLAVYVVFVARSAIGLSVTILVGSSYVTVAATSVVLSLQY